MTNDSFATATPIAGDSGSAHYDDTNATGQAWFSLTTTTNQLYTFTCDAGSYSFEVYSGTGPQWAGLTYVVGGYGSPMSFLAQAGMDYAIAIYPNTGDNNTIDWTSIACTVGWSEWVQAPDYLTSPDSLHSLYYGVVESSADDGSISGPLVNTATVVAGLQTTAATGAAAYNPGGNTNIQTLVSGVTQQNPGTSGYDHDCQVNYAQTVANLTIPTADLLAARDTYPPTLSALVEGADFLVIPGTSDYVEYEATSSTLVGWQDWVVPMRYYEQFNGSVAPQAIPSRISFSNPPITDWAYGSIPPWQSYGVGSPLVTITTPVGAPSDYVATGTPGVVSRDTTANVTIPLSLMGTAAAVSLFMQPTHLGGGDVPGNVDVGGGPAGGPWGVSSILDHTAPMSYAYRMPRFRYWKVSPAMFPINQQLQRRDGLGRGGVPLARGQATRQTSNQARVTY